MTSIEQAREAQYRCPVCKVADEFAYLRCHRPDCTDGRDPRPSRPYTYREAVQPASPSTPVDGVGAEPRVKPLEWRGPDCDDEYVAFSIDKRYTILKPSDNGCRWLGGVGGYFTTVESAQAAAQADHERRILSALANPEAEERLRERVEAAEYQADYWRRMHDELAAEARLAQAEGGPAVTEAHLVKALTKQINDAITERETISHDAYGARKAIGMLARRDDLLRQALAALETLFNRQIDKGPDA